MNTEPLFDSDDSTEEAWAAYYCISVEELRAFLADAQAYRRHARAARLRQNHE